MKNLQTILEDEELAKEIRGAIAKHRKRMGGPRPEILESAAPGAPPPIAPQSGFEEAIVLSVGRPVLFVRKNVVEVPRSDTWAARLQAAKEHLDVVLPSVGRIEVKNHPDFEWLGTGWVVRPDVVVTNRHVAQEFALRSDKRFVFRQNPLGKTMSARIDFKEEYLVPDEDEWEVEEVLFIAPDPGPDVAFLRLKESLGRAPIPLAPADAEEKQDVAVIGYPAEDGLRNPGPDMSHIFGDVYNVKRLAPGRLTDKLPTALLHDCSTLGGNSGSVLIAIKTGQALGLHFGGKFHETNYAVPAPVIADLLETNVR